MSEDTGTTDSTEENEPTEDEKDLQEVFDFVDKQVEKDFPKDETKDSPGGSDDDSPTDKAGDDKKGGDKGGEKAPALSKASIQRAVLAGFPLEEAEKLPSDTALDVISDRLEKANAAASGKKPKDGKGPEGDDKSGEDDEQSGIKMPEYDPDRFEPEVVEVLDQFKAALEKQNELINGLQKNIVSSEQNFFDNKIAGLDKAYEETFGRGPTNKLPEGVALINRAKLERRMAVIEADAIDEGKPLAPDEIFDKAVKSAFGDVDKSVKAKEAKILAEKKRKQATKQPRELTGAFARPTDKPATTKEVEDDCLDFIGELMEKDA